MVRTPEQTVVFLRGVRRDRLYLLFHLLTYRGKRRPEELPAVRVCSSFPTSASHRCQEACTRWAASAPAAMVTTAPPSRTGRASPSPGWPGKTSSSQAGGSTSSTRPQAAGSTHAATGSRTEAAPAACGGPVGPWHGWGIRGGAGPLAGAGAALARGGFGAGFEPESSWRGSAEHKDGETPGPRAVFGALTWGFLVGPQGIEP